MSQTFDLPQSHSGCLISTLKGIGESKVYHMTWSGMRGARPATKRTTQLVSTLGSQGQEELKNNYGRERLQIELGLCSFKHLLLMHSIMFIGKKGQLLKRKLLCLLAEAPKPREMVQDLYFISQLWQKECKRNTPEEINNTNVYSSQFS